MRTYAILGGFMVLKKSFLSILLLSSVLSANAGFMGIIQGVYALAPCYKYFNAVEQSIFKACGYTSKRPDFIKEASDEVSSYVHNALNDMPGLQDIPVLYCSLPF